MKLYTNLEKPLRYNLNKHKVVCNLAVLYETQLLFSLQ